MGRKKKVKLLRILVRKQKKKKKPVNIKIKFLDLKLKIFWYSNQPVFNLTTWCSTFQTIFQLIWKKKI